MSEQFTDLGCCSRCEGNGRIVNEGTEYVTLKMAIDAGDRNMAGQPIRYKEWIRCPNCNGTGLAEGGGE